MAKDGYKKISILSWSLVRPQTVPFRWENA